MTMSNTFYYLTDTSEETSQYILQNCRHQFLPTKKTLPKDDLKVLDDDDRKYGFFNTNKSESAVKRTKVSLVRCENTCVVANRSAFQAVKLNSCQLREKNKGI